MKADEIRKKTVTEIAQLLHDWREEQFTLRMQNSGSQISQPHRIQGIRRDIARAKTILVEKSREGNE